MQPCSGVLYVSFPTKTTHAYASHIDLTALADGTYELVPESESEQREAQVNLTEATEDLNPSSEEPKAAPLRKASPGACPT